MVSAGTEKTPMCRGEENCPGVCVFVPVTTWSIGVKFAYLALTESRFVILLPPVTGIKTVVCVCSVPQFVFRLRHTDV